MVEKFIKLILNNFKSFLDDAQSYFLEMKGRLKKGR